jgi:ElaB/YqjD/DUF883 family membrane-anchored ribosome-binding protein
MAIQRKVRKTVRRLVAKATDPALRRKAQEAVGVALKQGRETLLRYEKELSNPATRRRLREQWKHAKADLGLLKTELKKRERQAVSYAKRQPEKALAAAAAVGIAAGIVVAALRRRRA